MTQLRGDLIDTPLGCMIALVDEQGALQRLEFIDEAPDEPLCWRGAAVQRESAAVAPVARQLQANARLLGCGRIHVVEADALHWLAQVRESFDVIVMDPPFATDLLAQGQDRDAHGAGPLAFAAARAATGKVHGVYGLEEQFFLYAVVLRHPVRVAAV